MRISLPAAVWLVLAAVYIADALWMLAAGFSMRWQGSLPLLRMPVILATGALFYHYIRRDRRITELMVAILQLMLFAPAMAVLSYLFVSLPFPLVDAQLIAFDHALGFDWRAHIEWLTRHIRVNTVLAGIYMTLMPQQLLLVIALAGIKQFTELQRYLLAFMLSAIVCSMFACLLPAVGGYIYYDIDVNHLSISPAAARVHETHLLGLRANELRSLAIEEMQGLITFPSFHVAAAVLVAYAARALHRIIFGVAVGLNAIMIVSVFSQGGHYLVDALGGAAIAAASIAAVRLLPPARSIA
ncbi:MAG: phosphatase PAP2 family protein [Alphaproteobacteria bacterium]|nr:phosphatase PAP2 family protein [Alphaproteobacteria bacterium]